MLPEFFTLARFCLYLNNQPSYGRMDATGGFGASNWSTNNPPRCSDFSWKWSYRGRINAAGIFHSEIGPDFACTSATSAPTDKWMVQVDSAHQTGLKPILHAVLIAGCWCFMAERTCGSGLTKTHCHQWLLSFYTYPANCPGKYLSSLVFTARIC